MTFRGTTLVLAISLAANAALLALIEVKAPELLRFDSPSKPLAAIPGPASAPGISTPALSFGPGSAGQLLKGDVQTVLARLKAAGFPRSVIRAYAQDAVAKQLQARAVAIGERLKPLPFWKARRSDFDQTAIADMGALNLERKKMVEALIGTDPSDSNPFGLAIMDAQRGGLTPEQFAKVDAIRSDYDDLRRKIRSAANGVITPDETEKLAYLDRQQATDMAAALPPDDLLSYDMHVSGTASSLRANLVAFNPTEDEFTAIFKAQQAFDAQYGSPDGYLTADQQQQRQAHQADLQAAIQQALGAQRYADYQTDTAPAYLAVSQVVQQLNLPPETTDQVVAMQADYSQQAAAINANSQLSPADKLTQLEALADEATAKLTAALGPRGFFAYQQANGSWLQALKGKGK